MIKTTFYTQALFLIFTFLFLAIWFVYRWLSRRGIQYYLEMEHTTFLVAKNGDIIIRSHLVRNLVHTSLAILGVGGLGNLFLWVYYAYTSMEFLSGSVVLVAVLLGGGVAYQLLFPAIQPRVHIKLAERDVDWMKLPDRYHYPFEDVSKVRVSMEKVQYHNVYIDRDKTNKSLETRAEIDLIFKDGSNLRVGIVCRRDAGQRSLIIAQTITKLIGVPVSVVGNE